MPFWKIEGPTKCLSLTIFIPDVIDVFGHVIEEVLRESDLDGGVVPAVGVAPESAGNDDSPVADQHDVGTLRGDVIELVQSFSYICYVFMLLGWLAAL